MPDSWLDIDADDLADLVHDRGDVFDLYRASPCPCSQVEDMEDESSRSESCEFGCMDGWLYTKSPLSGSALAIVTDYNKMKWSPDFGSVPSGTAKWISMAGEVLLGERDIVVLTTREDEVRELIRRGVDSLSHPEAFQVLEVRRGTTVYHEGEHFTLVPGAGVTRAAVHWLVTGPPEGEFYSVEYMRRPRLIYPAEQNRPARNNMAGHKLVQRVTLSLLPTASRDAVSTSDE
jgi:hypothetical protein